MNDKISIIMSVFNCEQTLHDAVDSIIVQTYSNWEFIICDDASTDSTYDILLEYQKQFPERFILLRNESNMRLAYSLNRCLEKATGSFIARMDGDDFSAPDRLEKEYNFLINHPEYDLVGTCMQSFEAEKLGNVLCLPEYVDKFSMRNGSPFFHATILTHKRVYDTLNGYTVCERTQRAQDHDLWFRFFHAGFRGYNLQEQLYYVREDINTFRRRTIRSRWFALETTRIGYELLGFPKRWLVKPFVLAVIKSLVPQRIVYSIRKNRFGKHR